MGESGQAPESPDLTYVELWEQLDRGEPMS